MIDNKLEREEKAVLLGMEAVFNMDICGQFECPNGGCYECPLHEVTVAQEAFLKAIEEAVG